MKTKAMLLFALVFGLANLSNAVYAQTSELTHRHKLELTIGDPFPIVYSGQYYSCGCGPDMTLTENPDGSHTMRVADYLEHNSCYPPTISLSYHYTFLPWLEAGLRLGYNYNHWSFRLRDIIEYPTGERDEKSVPDSEGRMFHHMGFAMASTRFPYFRRPLVQLYSGVAVGAAMDYYSPDHAPVGTTNSKLTFAYQVTALGVRVGNSRIYGLVELGYGHQGIANIGVGVGL